jgi:hypothetical protein
MLSSGLTPIFMTTPSDELDPLDLLEIEPDEAELSEEGLKRRGFHTADPKTADEDEEEDIPKAIELEEILVKADDDEGEDGSTISEEEMIARLEQEDLDERRALERAAEELRNDELGGPLEGLDELGGVEEEL